MKLHVASDLHFDHYSDYGRSILKYWNNDDKADALILAGDLMDGNSGTISERTESLKTFCELYPFVFMVMGNHDYYGSSFDGVDRRNEEYRDMFKNLIILEPGGIYKHSESGLRFAGGTLWYPENESVNTLKGGWPDFRLIKHSKSRIFSDNKKFRDHLNDSLAEFKPDVIISHMVPSNLGIHKDFDGDPYNCFFVSDETELIKKLQPKLWVFGHTHYPFDFKIGNTRLYCNPGTYPREGTNPGFINRRLIEV